MKAAAKAEKLAKSRQKILSRRKPKSHSSQRVGKKPAPRKGKKLGRAHALAGPGLWPQWLRFLRRHPRVSLSTWAAVSMTNLLCLRISEAGALRGSDFDLVRNVVVIGKSVTWSRLATGVGASAAETFS